MKKTLTLCALALAMAGTQALANTVNITNATHQGLSVRYKIALHNPGSAVRYPVNGTHTIMLNNHENRSLHLNNKRYKHVGIVVLAVKRAGQSEHWIDLPSSAKQFDQSPGCWLSTNHLSPNGTVSFSVNQGALKKKMTCSVSQV